MGLHLLTVIAFQKREREWYVQLLVGFIVWCSELLELLLKLCAVIDHCENFPFQFRHGRQKMRINMPFIDFIIEFYRPIGIMNEICGHYLFGTLRKCPWSRPIPIKKYFCIILNWHIFQTHPFLNPMRECPYFSIESNILYPINIKFQLKTGEKKPARDLFMAIVNSLNKKIV